MRYHLIVSHSGFASGLVEALRMLVGKREDVLQVSFQDGMALPAVQEQVRQVTALITAEDKVLVLADLVNGSPQRYVRFRAGLAAEPDALSYQYDLPALVVGGAHNIVV